MAYYMNKNVPAKRGDIFYISNSKCYATDPSNTEGRPAIVVSSDKLNEHADVYEQRQNVGTYHEKASPGGL